MHDERWYAWGPSVKDDNDKTVGVAVGKSMDFDTIDARARLMAAAPLMRDMLLALRAHAPEQIDSIMARLEPKGSEA
jgi:hypothetical protein